MINKTSLKFIGGFVAIVALAFGSIYYVSYYNSPEQKAIRYYADLERQYAEDTYGGKTPEETLQLFIDALKAGDIELASKYFVVDKREEWADRLRKIQESHKLESMIRDIVSADKGNDISESSSRFVISNENNEVITILNIARNPNGTWKIVNM